MVADIGLLRSCDFKPTHKDRQVYLQTTCRKSLFKDKVRAVGLQELDPKIVYKNRIK